VDFLPEGGEDSPRIRSYHDKAAPSESHAGIQGESGLGGYQGREDAFRSVLESKKKGRVSVVRVEHLAGVQEHDAAANPGKLMLDLERVHGGALRDDFLPKLAKSRNLPLTVAERIERSAQDVLAVNPERQVVGAADGEHAQVAVKHEQGFAHRVYDGLRERPRIFDVLERLNHAMNAPEPFLYGNLREFVSF
jgi:hypothetical protein